MSGPYETNFVVVIFVALCILILVFGSIWIEDCFRMWRSHREYNKESD